MSEYAVGLSDIAIYIPRPRITTEALIRNRIRKKPALERRLNRAVSSTGQMAIRFPELWQDSATLAAESLSLLMGRSSAWESSYLRYLAVGSETSVDQSKPISSYVHGMVQRAGHSIPETISNYQVQHACAGGTIALLGIGALLRSSGHVEENGVVICSDVARYETFTTAEITQGAGAVALLVEQNPRLLDIDIETQGYASKDVDDFFRPNGSVTARVKGGYSIQCYNEALEIAFQDHCRRRGEDPQEVLRSTDIFVFHAPFYEMASLAAHRLITSHLRLSGSSLADFLDERGFRRGSEPITRIGNIYSGSAYLSLAYQLAERHRALGDGIIGRNILIASYGSGNTMAVVSGRVASEAPGIISGWDLAEIDTSAREVEFAEYEEWIGAPYARSTYEKRLEGRRIPSGQYYLAGIREDGYHEYRNAE
jgi:hydroxymethylglutaryl-CoA synthase